ncbi:hypothetical protein THERMOT_2180 [Bathymodiolus thermophilus thioautotrophic gill symbiont]|nr:hypothetical protein THERMOT_2180 [Bathymodiolus thermophilus thioautotrophic gill symbiont]
MKKVKNYPPTIKKNSHKYDFLWNNLKLILRCLILKSMNTLHCN